MYPAIYKYEDHVANQKNGFLSNLSRANRAHIRCFVTNTINPSLISYLLMWCLFLTGILGFRWFHLGIDCAQPLC
jgi:hypothetical protein